jgi:hypothetical protein
LKAREKIAKVQLTPLWTMADSANVDGQGSDFGDELQALARKHWVPQGKKKLPKFNTKVVDQIFQRLSERSFPLRELLLLDQTLYLEK